MGWSGWWYPLPPERHRVGVTGPVPAPAVEVDVAAGAVARLHYRASVLFDLLAQRRPAQRLALLPGLSAPPAGVTTLATSTGGARGRRRKRY